VYNPTFCKSALHSVSFSPNSYSKTLIPLETNVIINDGKIGTPCGGSAADGEGDGACGSDVVRTDWKGGNTVEKCDKNLVICQKFWWADQGASSKANQQTSYNQISWNLL